MALGRPPKYKPVYCKKAKDFLSKGMSVKALCGKLGVAETTIYDWVKKYPDFSKSVALGRNLGEQQLLEKCNQMVTGDLKPQGLNALKFLMINLYRYSDQPKEETTDSKPININFTLAKKD